MAKKIRIENADREHHRVKINVMQTDCYGDSSLINSYLLDHAADMADIILLENQFLIVKLAKHDD
jgi:hypothetical protein